jgi:hypothetical protein
MTLLNYLRSNWEGVPIYFNTIKFDDYFINIVPFMVGNKVVKYDDEKIYDNKGDLFITDNTLLVEKAKKENFSILLIGETFKEGVEVSENIRLISTLKTEDYEEELDIFEAFNLSLKISGFEKAKIFNLDNFIGEEKKFIPALSKEVAKFIPTQPPPPPPALSKTVAKFIPTQPPPPPPALSKTVAKFIPTQPPPPPPALSKAVDKFIPTQPPPPPALSKVVAKFIPTQPPPPPPALSKVVDKFIPTQPPPPPPPLSKVVDKFIPTQPPALSKEVAKFIPTQPPQPPPALRKAVDKFIPTQPPPALRKEQVQKKEEPKSRFQFVPFVKGLEQEFNHAKMIKMRNNEYDYFPKRKEEYMYTNVSLYSSADVSHSLKTAELISKYYDISNKTLTEASACIGGNSWSFADKVKNINLVEIDDNNFKALKHNMEVMFNKDLVNKDS